VEIDNAVPSHTGVIYILAVALMVVAAQMSSLWDIVISIGDKHEISLTTRN